MAKYYSDKELACPNGRYWWIILLSLRVVRLSIIDVLASMEQTP